MSKNTIIRCDHCEKQLNIDSSYPHRWGLHLSSVDYGVNTTGMVYAVAQYPSLDRDMDFCGMVCLSKWLTNKMNDI